MFIYAHRGASSKAPENTLEAFQQAIDDNADGIELDVFQVDDEFIVIHDRWLHRTTTGSGLVTEHTLKHLRTLDAGNGQTIPLLSEVLSTIGNKCIINTELKGVNDIEKLVAYIRVNCQTLEIPLTNIVFSSFDHHLLDKLHQVDRSLRLAALTANKPLTFAKFAEDLHAEFINADITFVNQAFVDDAHARGLKMGVFTVDADVDLLKLQHWGVDAVFCNDPAQARVTLNGTPHL